MDREFHEALSQVQREQVPWVKRNFPDRTDDHPLFGVVEELGELMSARSLEDVTDAVADALIYMCDYASASRLVMSACYASATGFRLPLTTTPGDLLRTVGELCHHHLKMAQGIRGTEDEHTEAKVRKLGLLSRMLENYAVQRGLNIRTDLLETWAKVSKRNWRDWPNGESDHA